MEIIENSALQLTTAADVAERIRNAIEKSEILSTNTIRAQVLVNWEHHETERLAHIMDSYRPNLAIRIPSPMERDYKWPGLNKPFDHQRETAQFLSIRPRAFCFNQAGTGKTSSAIWAADYLMNLGLVKRVLVICPLSIIYTAWQNELFTSAMHRRSVVAYSKSPRKRRELVSGDYEFTVINYDGINTVLNEIKAKQYDLIIVDEANAYKTATTTRWKTLAKLLSPSTRLWLMTGTPAAQSPVDAFGLARLVAPDRLPKYVTAWRDQVMTQVSKFTWVPKRDAREKVFKVLQPAIRFTKDECLDLPPVTYQNREVPLSVQAARYYKALKAQLMLEVAGHNVSAVNAAAALSKLLQISGGAAYTDEHGVIEFDITPRLAALKEVLDECDRKVIVFVPYLHTIPIITGFLSKSGVTNEVIHGDVTASKRREIITSFQEQADPKVLVIQPASASHGVTLTAADTMVFWSPVMSVDTYLQCVARIDRIGQTSHMTVVKLIGSEVERKVYSMLESKIDSHQSLVDLYKSELESNDE